MNILLIEYNQESPDPPEAHVMDQLQDESSKENVTPAHTRDACTQTDGMFSQF
jgi:hypothetical protein